MASSTIWWLVAAFLFSLEVLSGSYYLLLLAMGAVAGAISAGFDVPQLHQMVIASAIGSGSVALWHRHLLRRGVIDIDGRNTTGLGELDVGEEVKVLQWNSDGTARVRYRGDHWHAMHHGPHLPRAGVHRIRCIEQTHLVLEPVQG